MLDLGRTFLQSVERAPLATAIVDGEQRLTYAQWAGKVGAVQRGLENLGLRAGDHLVSLLQNRMEAATLHWACQFAGIVMTPLNWRAKPEEIVHCLQDSGACVLVYEMVCAEAVDEAIKVQPATLVFVGKGDAAGTPYLACFAGDWKLVVNAAGGTELFHLGSDPGETRDLLAAEPGVAAILRSRLAEIEAGFDGPVGRAPPPRRGRGEAVEGAGRRSGGGG